jgi:transcriptional regulator with XRE-family HTH domain
LRKVNIIISNGLPRITELRKAKSWSQADLAKAIEASRDIIGKYERNENSPSVEMALKIARVFDVPVDYLLGEGKHASYDKETVKRLEDIETMVWTLNIWNKQCKAWKSKPAFLRLILVTPLAVVCPISVNGNWSRY